jgi:hypothetical protein
MLNCCSIGVIVPPTFSSTATNVRGSKGQCQCNGQKIELFSVTKRKWCRQDFEVGGATWRARSVMLYEGLGRSTQRVQGQNPCSGGQGAKPPEAGDSLYFNWYDSCLILLHGKHNRIAISSHSKA